MIGKRHSSVDGDVQSTKFTVLAANANVKDSVGWLKDVKGERCPDDDALRQKEIHLQNLGLITHKAAEKRRLKAAIEAATKASVGVAGSTKQEETQQTSIESTANTNSSSTQQGQNLSQGKRGGKGNSITHPEYTGTLKTVIKLNRNSINGCNFMSSGSGSGVAGGGRKSNSTNSPANGAGSKDHRRQSLKMTFQKGRGGRCHSVTNNADRDQNDGRSNAEDSYYTIHNEVRFTLIIIKIL